MTNNKIKLSMDSIKTLNVLRKRRSVLIDQFQVVDHNLRYDRWMSDTERAERVDRLNTIERELELLGSTIRAIEPALPKKPLAKKETVK